MQEPFFDLNYQVLVFCILPEGLIFQRLNLTIKILVFISCEPTQWFLIYEKEINITAC